VLYVAVEPFVRRRWPQTLITWTRILSGEFRDPLVGRDILVGSTIAIAMTLFETAAYRVDSGFRTAVPDALNGGAAWLADLCSTGATGVNISLVILFLIFAFRLITRNDKAAMATFIVVVTLLSVASTGGAWIRLPFMAVFFSLMTLSLMRLGFLSMAVGYVVGSLLALSPITFRRPRGTRVTALLHSPSSRPLSYTASASPSAVTLFSISPPWTIEEKLAIEEKLGTVSNFLRALLAHTSPGTIGPFNSRTQHHAV